MFLVLLSLIIAKSPNNPIGLLDGGGVGKRHSPMHRKNVPKMPLMIRTRSGRAKESFFQVWHKSHLRNTNVRKRCRISLAFYSFPLFLLLLLLWMNIYILECQPRGGKHFHPYSMLFAWGWYFLVYMSWNLWPVTRDYHVSLWTCQRLQLLASTSEGKLLRVGVGGGGHSASQMRQSSASPQCQGTPGQ